MADPLETPQPPAPGPTAPFKPTGLVTGPLITPAGETTDLDVPAGNLESFDPGRDIGDVGSYLERHGYMAGGPTGFLENQPTQAGKSVAPHWSPAPTLSADEANQQYGLGGQLKFNGDIPVAAAKSLYDQKVAYLKRQEILARQQGGFFNRAAQFGVGAINMALDPIDAASAFIPVVGEARYASWLAGASGAFSRAALRTSVGAAAGAVAQAPLSALRFGLSYENQQDYNAVNALMDIAFGGIMGGGLHAAGGMLVDAFGRRRPATAAILPHIIEDLPLETRGAALRTAVAQAVQGQPVDVRPYFEAHHGSPAEFTAFSDEKIGTGEGAAAYGVGHYLAEAPDVAETYAKNVIDKAYFDQVNERMRVIANELDQYRIPGSAEVKPGGQALKAEYDRLLEERAAKKGNLYKVAVEGTPEHFLDWDKPLSEQSPEVKAALNKVDPGLAKLEVDPTGEQILNRIGILRSPGKTLDRRVTSQLLNEAGIPGIRYLDQGSRAHRVILSTKAGAYAENRFNTRAEAEAYVKAKEAEGFTAAITQAGTRNFVVFDPKRIRILERNGKPIAPPEPEAPKGSAASAAKSIVEEASQEPPRTIEQLRNLVDRLSWKIAEFEAAGLDNVADLYREKLRALGYEPKTPAALRTEFEARGANATSRTVQPPGAQALPSQVSTLPEPSGSSTTRENAPSILAGPKATFTLGEMDAATNRKIIQGSADLKELHALATATLKEVNKRLFNLVRDIPGAELAGSRVKTMAGLEEKAKTRPPQTISDYLGGRIVVDDPAALAATLDKLRGAGRLLEVEDFLGSDKKAGYRAVHVQFDLGNGMSMELQLVPKEIRAVQDEAHAIYDTFKRIDPLTADPKEMKLLAAGRAKVQALYDKAWKPVAEKWGQGGGAETAETIPAKFIKNDVAVLPGGEEVKVRYAIVDAKDLTPSQLPSMEPNPKYPAALQPRDRTRSASAVQVRTIAQKMNPKLLGENPNAADGAPIVGPDGVVESGNGRVMAIHMAYSEKMPGGKAYRDYLAEQGYPIDHLKEPVLVRIRDQPMTTEERAQFARQANQRTTLAMGTAEEARADASALSDDILDLHRGGDIGLAANRDFVKAFQRDIVGGNEGAAMVDKEGSLTKKGRDRIEAALLAKAYDDPGILAALLEDPESNIKAIGKAITEVSARWALMRKEAAAGQINPEVDISRDLIDAVNLVRKARDQGVKINDLVNQADAFSGTISPEAEAMLNIFFKPKTKKGEVPFTKPNSMDTIAAALDKYVNEARKSAGGPGLFGGADVVGPQEILGRAGRQGETGQQAALFGEPSRGASAGGSVENGGEPGGGPGALGTGPSPANDSLGHALRTQADPNTGFADAEDLAGQRAAEDRVARGEPKAPAPAGEESSPDVAALEQAMAADQERLDAAVKAGAVPEDEAASLKQADQMVTDAEDRAKGIEEAAACLGRNGL